MPLSNTESGLYNVTSNDCITKKPYKQRRNEEMEAKKWKGNKSTGKKLRKKGNKIVAQTARKRAKNIEALIE